MYWKSLLALWSVIIPAISSSNRPKRYNPYLEKYYNAYEKTEVLGYRLDEKSCSCECNYESEEDPLCTWTMVFKSAKGNGRQVYEEFMSRGSINMDVPGSTDAKTRLPYRDGRILDNWNKRVIYQVKIELFTGGTKNTWFVFDGLGSEFDNWMTRDRLIDAPYPNIKTTNSLEFNLTKGGPDEHRSFSILEEDGECADYCGYLVVLDESIGGNTTTCNWDTLERYPYFIYAKAESSRCKGYEAEHVVADRFTISVKMCDKEM